MKDLDAATQLVHAGRDWDPEWGCVKLHASLPEVGEDRLRGVCSR